MSKILRESVIAHCPACGDVELAAGEFWPAYCLCGRQLESKESGIQLHFREELKREFEGLAAFEERMTREGADVLRDLGVKV
jgi:hypothetical protein